MANSHAFTPLATTHFSLSLFLMWVCISFFFRSVFRCLETNVLNLRSLMGKRKREHGNLVPTPRKKNVAHVTLISPQWPWTKKSRKSLQSSLLHFYRNVLGPWKEKEGPRTLSFKGLWQLESFRLALNVAPKSISLHHEGKDSTFPLEYTNNVRYLVLLAVSSTFYNDFQEVSECEERGQADGHAPWEKKKD